MSSLRPRLLEAILSTRLTHTHLAYILQVQRKMVSCVHLVTRAAYVPTTSAWWRHLYWTCDIKLQWFRAWKCKRASPVCTVDQEIFTVQNFHQLLRRWKLNTWKFSINWPLGCVAKIKCANISCTKKSYAKISRFTIHSFMKANLEV